MYRGYKYRIYPTTEQKEYFLKTFGFCRLVYNRYLELRTAAYEGNQENLTYIKCAKVNIPEGSR